MGRIGHKVIFQVIPTHQKFNSALCTGWYSLVSIRLIGFAINFSEDLEIDEEPPPPPSAVAGMDIESPSPEQSLVDGETPFEQEEPISGIEEEEETPEQEEAEEAEEPGEEEQGQDEEEAKSEGDISEMEPEP